MAFLLAVDFSRAILRREFVGEHVTEVVFLGSSDAFAAGARRQSATLVRTDDGSVLVDCSGTAITGLAIEHIPRNEISAIIITHYHGDHFMGVPQFLLAALYADERRSPLHIAGPEGIEKRIRELAQILGYSIEDRQWPFSIHFHDLRPGIEMEIGPVHVTPFQTLHQAETQPHGIVLCTDSHRIVFSGDTGWFEGLTEMTQDADLFICECTNYDRGYEYHMNFRDLYEHRDAFGCRRIILTHLGPSMSSRRGSCAMETAEDGLRIKL